ARSGCGSSFLAQRVPDTAHGVDQPGLAAALGLAPQVADVDVEGVRREAEVVAPDALEDQRPRQHLARVEEEQLEQRELGPRQLDPLAAARHLARAGIELDVGEAERLAGAVAGAAQQRADAREQLLERERLRQVVVGAGVEPLDPVLDLRARGQHQDRNLAALAAQRPRDLEPVDARHQHVEHHRVGLRLVLEALERLRPVLGQLDLVALELERAPQRLPDGPLVVDHQDLHRRIVAAEAEIRVRTPCKARHLRKLLSGSHVALKVPLEDHRRHRSRDPPKPLCDERPRSGGALSFLRDFLTPFQAALRARVLSWSSANDLPTKGTSPDASPLAPDHHRCVSPRSSLPRRGRRGRRVLEPPRQRQQHGRQAGDRRASRPGLRRAPRGVVEITVTEPSSSSTPFGGGGGTQQAQGSGWVYDTDGHIVTNDHVVDGATSIKVRFSDGKTYSATTVGTDRSTDLAVIKVDAPSSELYPLSVGDSTQL